jgi:hypothetical protein
MRFRRSRPWRDCIVAAAITMPLTACEVIDQPAESWRGTLRDLPGGVVLVSNSDDGIWSPADAWRLTADLTIGRPEGDGPDVFWRIVDFAEAPGGDVFVLDQSQEVRQFRSTGEFVRKFGSQGEGPGEFQGAIGIAFDREGNAWIADGTLKRYTVFRPDGTLLRTTSMVSEAVGAFDHWPGVFDSAGRLYETSIGTPIPAKVPFTCIRLDRDGHVDTIPALSYDFPLFNGFPPPPDIVRRFVFALDTANAVWSAYTDQYRIVQQRLDSWDTLRIIERPLVPVPLTDAEQDSIARQMARLHVGVEQLPEHRPLIQQIYSGPGGTLLVQLVTPPRARESVFDVLDPQGRLLGQVRTQERLVEGFLDAGRQVFGDRIYGVAADSLGVQRLVRYRIARPH